MGYLPTAAQIAELEAAVTAAEAAKQALMVAIYGAYSPNPHILHAEDEDGDDINLPVSEYSAGLLTGADLAAWKTALGITDLTDITTDFIRTKEFALGEGSDVTPFILWTPSTGNSFELWTSDGGTTLASISNEGNWNIDGDLELAAGHNFNASTGYFDLGLQANSPAADVVPFLVTADLGHTAHLQDWKVDDVVKAYMLPDGTIHVKAIEADDGFDVTLAAALDSIGALTPAADRLPYYTGADAAALATFTSFARSLMSAADATAAKTALEISPSGTGDVVGPSGAVSGNLALFDSATGKSLGDSDIVATDVALKGSALAADKILRTDANGELSTANSVSYAQLAYLDLTGALTLSQLLAQKMDVGGAISEADTLDTYHASTTYQSAQTAYIPVVNADGTLEIGPILDMHVAGSTADYNARLGANTSGFQFYTDTTWSNGEHLIFGTSSGSKIGTGTTQKIGFWNATPVVRPSAYTQTYSTADKTHAAKTASALTNNTGVLPYTTIGPASGTYSASNINSMISGLVDMINRLRVDHLDLAQFTNSIVDDLQTIGLVG